MARWIGSAVFAVVVVVGAGEARGQGAATAKAGELMGKRMYHDAAKVLEESIASRGDVGSGQELRMLAECSYLLKDYGKARPLYLKALDAQTTEQGRIICESRLAILSYRLLDYRTAEQRIENFIRKYPTNKRVGNLMMIRVKINAESKKPLAEKIQIVQGLARTIGNNRELYGYQNSVLANKALGDLYIRSGQTEKAVTLFVRAVHEMRALLNDLKAADDPIPKDLMQGVDTMSLQIAKHYIDRKNWSEAEKWLENVAYLDDMVWKARLLLAQITYRKRDYVRVVELLPESFLRTVPASESKAGMLLLLGFSFKERNDADLERSKEYLKRVPAGTAGYHQAQHGLGDIYREQQDPAKAEPHYLISRQSPKYAPAAYFHLGNIYGKRAEAQAKDEAKATELRQTAATQYEILLRRYPLTAVAEQAKPLVARLQQLGARVDLETSAEDKLKAWNAVIKNKPGSNEAAQALLSVAQHHARTLTAPNSPRVIKAANWPACVEACQTLLKNGATPFTGVAPERWAEMRARALFYSGRAELGSLPIRADAVRGRMAVPLKGGGDADRAIALLRQAAALTPGEPKDFAKEVDLTLIEAMFKSTKPATRAAAEELYRQREATYGNDTQFQKLAVDLAHWYADQKQHLLAAESYRALARRAELDREEIMHLLYLAGVNYNKAGRQIANDSEAAASVGLFIYPKELLKTAPITKTHAPFQEVRLIRWPAAADGLPALDVLKRVSKEFGVPFVWSPDPDVYGFVAHLNRTTISKEQLREFRSARSLEDYIGLLVDLERFRLEFDIGTTGGTPTLPPPSRDDPDRAGSEAARVIEILLPTRERFPKMATSYGVFSDVHPGSAMVFHVIERMEELTKAKITWADGVEKDDVLAHEYAALPGDDADKALSCREVFSRVLDPLGLKFKIVRRDRAAELINESNDCFNELRKFGMDTSYAERAMFNLGVNFYYLNDFEKMKLVLREYLKVFDTPVHHHYYDACFWLGWCFERDRKFRDAIKYYTIASEESVALYKRADDEPLAPLDEVKAMLGFDTLYQLSLPADGSFNGASLAGDFVNFIRFNSNVELKLGPAVAAAGITNINRSVFTAVPCIDLIHDVMRDHGLGLRTENGNAKVAEKTYYRLAVVYKKDNLMQQALENVVTLLDRFPDTTRKVDAVKLKLDAYKGMKDYGKALAALEELREAGKDKIEPYMLDYEAARMHYDMCNYAMAARYYGRALSGSEGKGEWLKIREALAHAYFRREASLREARRQYKDLLRYETTPLRHSINTLMVYYLDYALAEPDAGREPLPDQERQFIEHYESLSEKARGALGREAFARATWVYYIVALQDLKEGLLDEALEKFTAVGNSPDSFLAGDALVQAARIHMQREEYKEAREALEHLLFVVKAVEPTVRATYYLGQCHQRLEQTPMALRRFQEVVVKYPISPYAELIRQDPFYLQHTGQAPAAGTNDAAAVTAPAGGAL